MKNHIRVLGALSAVGALAATIAFAPSAEAVYVEPSAPDRQFPVGIFFPPDPTQTSVEEYARIAEFGANFIVGTNEVVTHGTNLHALDAAAANGIQVLAHDWGLVFRTERVRSGAAGDATPVRRDNVVGQTFSLPAGAGWTAGVIGVPVDRDSWKSHARLKLCLYDTPTKATLWGCDTVTGPPPTDLAEFAVNSPTISAASAYLELTTPDNYDIAVEGSAADSYSGGDRYVNGAVETGDLAFEVRLSTTDQTFTETARPSDEYLESLVDDYSDHPAFLGYHIKDEPARNTFPAVSAAIEKLRVEDPDNMSYVNLLPTYATQEQLFGGAPQVSTADTVSSTRSVGQTFRTRPDQTSLTSLQFYIDSRSSIQSGTPLTVTLWDSPAKATQVAQGSLTSFGTPATDFPTIPISAVVTPSTDYYIELSYAGTNEIGGVVHSPLGTEWETDGTGYLAGAAADWDLWFAVDQTIVPFSYEDYVYRWMRTNPDVLVFDHYPFVNAEIRGDFYSNLEIIRRQASEGDVPFWSFLQSFGTEEGWRIPSEGDMALQFYANLAYGAKGLIYFTYYTPPDLSWNENFLDGLIRRDGTENVTYASGQANNSVASAWADVLNTAESTGVYHVGSVPSGSLGVPSSFALQPTSTGTALVGALSNADDQYVMVVNKNNVESQTISFSVAGSPTSLDEVSKLDGSLAPASGYTASSGTLQVTLQPGEGRLFRLP
ncbi:hypothetical protein [Herbiconiux sp. A18JL235]|uniref:Glycoside hydrolase family 42 N-terminal domain-containing protein n=1 Tax=Herbiconiux sp. A18JL235 TaxID=3152363 RepID=A0AB39BIN1_9MICO